MDAIDSVVWIYQIGLTAYTAGLVLIYVMTFFGVNELEINVAKMAFKKYLKLYPLAPFVVMYLAVKFVWFLMIINIHHLNHETTREEADGAFAPFVDP